jgi:hypothetical protein
VRTFGEVRGVEQLTTPYFTRDEATGWQMTSVDACLLGAEAMYRAPMRNSTSETVELYGFMLLSNFRRPN